VRALWGRDPKSHNSSDSILAHEEVPLSGDRAAREDSRGSVGGHDKKLGGGIFSRIHREKNILLRRWQKNRNKKVSTPGNNLRGKERHPLRGGGLPKNHEAVENN